MRTGIEIADQVDRKQVRVWIYRSVVKLDENMEAEITQLSRIFVQSWAAHGKKLTADFKIYHHHYLVFFVDQNWANASGCSIDSSVAFIRELDQKLHLGLLNRMEIGFLKGETVIFHNYNKLKELYSSGIIHKDDLVFNALVQDLEEFESQFLQKFSESPFYRMVE